MSSSDNEQTTAKKDKPIPSIDSRAANFESRPAAADVIVPHRPPGISPIDNPGVGTAPPPFQPSIPPPPPPSAEGGGEQPQTPLPPQQGGGGQPNIPNPSDLQLYLFDATRQVLIPFRADYSTSIPFAGMAVPGAGGEKTFVPFSANARVPTPRSDKKIGVIVPLIKIAPNSADWMQLVSIAQRQPYPDVIAIVNPSLDARGIAGTGSPNAVFANGINYLVNAGIRVVGYINTNKTSKSVATIQSEISKWFEWYPNISGIYFDDMSTDLPDNPTPSAVGNIVEYYKNLDQMVKQKHKQVQGRHGIQQQVGAAITILNLAAGKSPSAATTKPFYRGLFQDTDIDIITIYEQEGYPTDQNYGEIKAEWMSNHPRSRFAIVAYHAGETDIEIRNFVDKVTEIEKVAGYIYATTEWITNMSEATALSPLTGTILDQMSQLAQQTAIPSSRGAGPSSASPDLSNYQGITQMTDMSEESRVFEETKGQAAYDKLGVRMIYPTAPGAASKQWFLRRDLDPKKDESLRNLPKGLRRLDNGVFETRKQDADQVRIEAWSREDKKFLNVEISGYFRVIESEGRYLIQQYARGGHHFSDQGKWCEGSAYKGRLLKDGTMCAVKEVHHNAYANNRGITQATNKRLLQRWFGMKTVIYNYHIPDTKSNILTSRLGVAIELWIDDNADDGSGNLVVKNDWRHVATIRDQGGWFAPEFKNGKGFLADKCKPMSEDNKSKYRKRDEILSMPGGTSDQNCVAWRWDDATVQFSHLSVREIQRIAAD